MCQFPLEDKNDDKYAKSAAGGKVKHSNFGKVANLPYQYLIYGLVALLIVHALYNGDDGVCKFITVPLEILGLLTVREKIKSRNSVTGISGMTFVMQAAVYFTRVPWSLKTCVLEFSVWEAFNVTLGICSLLLVLDILRSIFQTHRDSYDDELDVLKAWYVIPACFAAALLMRPSMLDSNAMVTYFLSSVMYMDALTLMPQVMMMAKSEGKVEVPIANFVAATAVARCGDVFHTIFVVQIASDASNFACFRLWMNGELDDEANSFVFSWAICVLVHIVQLVLVIDFLYYFYQAKVWRLKATQDVGMFVV